MWTYIFIVLLCVYHPLVEQVLLGQEATILIILSPASKAMDTNSQ